MAGMDICMVTRSSLVISLADFKADFVGLIFDGVFVADWDDIVVWMDFHYDDGYNEIALRLDVRVVGLDEGAWDGEL